MVDSNGVDLNWHFSEMAKEFYQDHVESICLSIFKERERCDLYIIQKNGSTELVESQEYSLKWGLELLQLITNHYGHALEDERRKFLFPLPCGGTISFFNVIDTNGFLEIVLVKKPEPVLENGLPVFTSSEQSVEFGSQFHYEPYVQFHRHDEALRLLKAIRKEKKSTIGWQARSKYDMENAATKAFNDFVELTWNEIYWAIDYLCTRRIFSKDFVEGDIDNDRTMTINFLKSFAQAIGFGRKNNYRAERISNALIRIAKALALTRMGDYSGLPTAKAGQPTGQEVSDNCLRNILAEMKALTELGFLETPVRKLVLSNMYPKTQTSNTTQKLNDTIKAFYSRNNDPNNELYKPKNERGREKGYRNGDPKFIVFESLTHANVRVDLEKLLKESSEYRSFLMSEGISFNKVIVLLENLLDDCQMWSTLRNVANVKMGEKSSTQTKDPYV